MRYIISLAILVLLSCNMSIRGYDNLAFPVGIRLNNPGDIKRTHIHWNGMTRLQDDPKLIRFKTPYDGVRAIMKILLTYKDIHDLDTISTIISRYAPPEDGNFTQSYIQDVSRRTGFFANESVDIKNEYFLVSITKAIVIHEQGIAPIEFPDAWYEDVFYYKVAQEVLKEEKENGQ